MHKEYYFHPCSSKTETPSPWCSVTLAHTLSDPLPSYHLWCNTALKRSVTPAAEDPGGSLGQTEWLAVYFRVLSATECKRCQRAMLVGAVTHSAVGKITAHRSPGKMTRGSKMDRQTRRWTDRRGWQMWKSGRRPGEAAFCFCVGNAQTRRSNNHTNRGELRPHSTANLLCGKLAQRWLSVGPRWHLDKVYHSGQACKQIITHI